MPVEYGTKEWEELYEKILEDRKSAPEPYILATPEWVHEYMKKINEDGKYREVGKKWASDLALGVGAKPEAGIDEEIFLLLVLSEGECKDAKLVPKEAAEAAPYLMSGSYDIWRKVVRGEAEALKSVMRGEMSLKGDLGKIMKYVAATKRLGDLSGSFEASWPEELSSEDLEEFRASFNELRVQLGL